MRPISSKIDNLKSLINNLYQSEATIKKTKTIKIPYAYAKFFEDMEKTKIILTKKEEIVKDRINEGNITGNISCRRLADKFNNIVEDDHISKSTVHRLLRKKLKLPYRKTSIKTDKLLNKNLIKQGLFILYIITRFLEMGRE